jgi:hypothetical protein
MEEDLWKSCCLRQRQHARRSSWPVLHIGSIRPIETHISCCSRDVFEGKRLVETVPSAYKLKVCLMLELMALNQASRPSGRRREDMTGPAQTKCDV